MSKAVIASAFKSVFKDLQKSGHSEYWFKGGRGSTKSSAISLFIVDGIVSDPQANAICYRRVGQTLKDSVYSQIIWAYNTLGLGDLFTAKLSPLEIIYKPTGQRILFRGTDDPNKSKSIKLTNGYFKYLWFEELAEFRSMEDIRVIQQSIIRGGGKAFTFYSYNPPKSARIWVNEESLLPNPYRYVHESTYLDIIDEHPDWLGESFVERADALRITNEIAYRNEYLGEVTGTGGNVFENLEIRTIKDEELQTLQWFYQGIDWGYFPDPFAWVRCAYDPRKRYLYIIDELALNKYGNREAYEKIKDKLRKDEALTADSAEPKSIADFREFGAWWIRGVVKGAGSVEYSVKWLASLGKIIIDPRCKNSAREFSAYEYARNAKGEYIDGFVDGNDHFIDSTRYALYPCWKNRGE